jgi:hypothetical protein
MDLVSYFLGGLVLLGMTANGLLKRIEKSTHKFPSCRTCGKPMARVPLPRVLPAEVLSHLDRYQLPAAAASRFICPKGDYQLWYIPQFGNQEKAFFLREEV